MATITSLGIGSGLDLNGLLDQLRAAEQQKLVPIQAQKQQQQAKISAYGQLTSSLSQFQTAAKKLADPALYQGLSAEVRGGSAIKATASSDASPGRYDVAVTQLARAGSLATESVSSTTDALAGENASLTITFGNDTEGNPITQTISFDEGDSLEAMRNAINAFDFGDGPGVNASIINDGTGSRLALNSTTTGVEAGITDFNFTGLADGQTLAADEDTRYAARNAELNVNGIAITSQTNRVEGAIEGVTIDVERVTEEDSPNTIVVARNTLAVREAIEGFVKGYNDLKDKITELTAFNGGGDAAGDLIGDRAARSIESQLRSALAGSVPGGEITRLSDIGITLRTNGTLELDSSKMSDAVATQQDEIAAFFAGNEETGTVGFASLVDEVNERLLGDNGALGSAQRSAEGRVSSLDDRLERTERSIERTIDRYRKQFGQLDAMISQMNSTSGFLFQQLNMLNAQMTNNN